MLPLISNLSIIVAFLTSVTVYFTGKPYKYLRLFPVFLLITCINQVIGTILSTHAKSNIVLYNLITPFTFCFYFYTYSLMVEQLRAKRMLVMLCVIFALLCALNMFFIQGLYTFNTMSYALGSLLIVAVCIYYFLQLFSHPTNVAREPGFWISVGLLFFHAATFPLLGLSNFMRTAPVVIRNNFGTILYLLNILLYSSFTIAFLCRIKVRNSMS